MIGLMGTFFCANWEEYHMGVLRCSQTIFGISSGLTESQFLLMSVLLAEGLSFGTFSQVTMRNIGMMMMPSVSEANVQHKIQHLLNTTNIVRTEDERVILEVFSKVHWFAELRLVQMVVCLGSIPTSLGMLSNIYTVLT
jgi:hypothetical protein